MRDRLRLPLHFDAESMRRDLERLKADDWIPHFVRQNYEGEWDVLPLRAPAGARHAIETIYSDPSSEVFADTPLLERCRYFQDVLAAFQCPLQAVRLMRLTPGSAIRPHNDYDLATEYGRARLHIPVSTNRQVDFRLNGERVVMQEGECWYLRLSDMHSVVNGGTTDRVHLVIDALVNPWFESMLDAAERLDVPANTPPPASSDLEQFLKLVAHDASLQKELTGVDERSAFVALAIRLASEHGLRITEQQIEDAMRETRRSWRERVA